MQPGAQGDAADREVAPQPAEGREQRRDQRRAVAQADLGRRRVGLDQQVQAGRGGAHQLGD